jgi:hypothetical protein
MTKKIITVQYNGEPLEITIRNARSKDGILRAELMGKASLLEESNPSKYTAFYIHPTCIAAVDEPEWVRTMTLDQFGDVDEQDIAKWLDAVYEINTHWKNAWRVLHELTEAQEKKTGASLIGSQMPTEIPITPETSPPSKS